MVFSAGHAARCGHALPDAETVPDFQYHKNNRNFIKLDTTTGNSLPPMEQ
jgi:hypothetical protein